ncbi:MAG: hypothetical protein Q9217_001932 [Psora testacea]
MNTERPETPEPMLMSICILAEEAMPITLEEFRWKERILLDLDYDKIAIGQALWEADYDVLEAFWILFWADFREWEREYERKKKLRVGPWERADVVVSG